MQDKFYDKLEKLLKKEKSFLDQEGDLLKSAVIDAAYKIEPKLIELLLEDSAVKKKFFSEIKKHWVFDINGFVAYIQDKHFLNDSYTMYKNKIGLNIDAKFLYERKEVALVWPFKDCVLEGGMTKEDEKRKEVFFNELLAQDEIDRLFAPKVLTNWKRYTKKGEEKVKEIKRDKDGTIRENLIIKGNNLLALHSLKQEFQGKVKLIYIDPPYNTGNDSFGYNDSFNHSTWLTFIKNRLEVGRELLREDGSIFVHCDDNEQPYLKVLMDEIFDRNNFIGFITIKSTPGGKQSGKNIAIMGDYILVYGKSDKSDLNGLPLSQEYIAKYDKEDKNGKYLTDRLRQHGIAERREDVPTLYFPIYYNEKNRDISTVKKQGYSIEVLPILPSGGDGRWIWGKEKIEKDKDMIEIKRIKRNGGYVFDAYFKKYLSEDLKMKLPSIWIDKEFRNEVGTKELKLVFEGERAFSYPKPEPTIQRVIECATKNGDIVLDFFAGSGTTGAVALKMNRHFILCEQMDYVADVTIKRIVNVVRGDQSGISKSVNWQGGGDFIYFELMKYNEKFIEEIAKAKDTKTLLKVWEDLKEKAFFKYNIDLQEFEKSLPEFKKLSLNKQKETLIRLLNKNQLYVNLSEMGDKEFKVGEEEKLLNKKFYGN